MAGLYVASVVLAVVLAGDSAQRVVRLYWAGLP